MPYYLLFENLPPERPVEPLHGVYEKAHRTIPLSVSPDHDSSDGGAMRWLRRLFTRRMFAKLPSPDQKAVVRISQVLRDAGFRTIECNYDGGNDEGFSNLDTGTTKDETYSANEMIVRLRGTKLGHPDFDPWETASRMRVEEREIISARRDERSEDETIDDWLEAFVEVLAVVLLGEGYGTGEYAMVGRFRFDLRTGELTDLPLEPPPDFREMNAMDLDDYYASEDQD